MTTATSIRATFEITGWDEHAYDVHAGTAKTTRAKVQKSYSGDVEGTSHTEWLMAYADDGTATFVGLERLTATVDGQEGTFVLQHVGTFADGAARATLEVVAGSGTGGFEGATGAGDLIADPAGSIRLDLARPRA